MKRREFVRRTMLVSSIAGTGIGLGMPVSSMAATCALENRSRTLVNLMLYGGMDSRFLFMPAPEHYNLDYVNKIWAARRNIYSSTYPDYAAMFANEYLRVSYAGGLEFGVYKQCGWLANEFNAGNVAIIANSYCSRNRRHDQSQLNANVGEPEFNELIYDRSGWGGRLQEQQSANRNVVELSHEISVFGNGSLEGDRLGRVIHAKNIRDIALPNVDTSGGTTSRRDVMTRALRSFYEARGAEAGNQPGSPYNIFFQHNDAFRAFGDAVTARVAACGDLPVELSGLVLNSNHFEQQCKNLYDIALMDTTSIDTQILSMRYDGWDSHNNQLNRISNNLEDLFGSSGGLATAMKSMQLLDSNAAEKMVFNCTSDFGRQLQANGDRGTDHGRGIYTVLLGNEVSGGTYGEMFPEREAQLDSNNRIPLETSGADILGLTSTEKIQAALCDWVEPNSGSVVFPNASLADEESPGLLSGILV